MRSDKTSSDEARIWINVILVVVTAITMFLSFQFFKMAYRAVEDSYLADLLALASCAALEIAKIRLGRTALRALVFKWIAESWAALGYWGFVLLLAIAAFVGSVVVSTKGMHEYAMIQGDNKEKGLDRNQYLKDATAAIDAQIATESAARDANMSNKYKGNIVYESLKASKVQNKNLESLQNQRTTLLNNANTDFDKLSAKREGKISLFAQFILLVGGWMELVAGMCLIAGAFATKRLVEVVLDNGYQLDNAPERVITQDRQPVAPTPNGNGRPNFNNNYTRTQIGFHRDRGVPDLSVTAPLFPPHIAPPVTHSDTSVSPNEPTEPPQNVETKSQNAYKHFQTDFNRWKWKLANGHGDRKTACEWIAKCLDGMIYHHSEINDHTRQQTEKFLYEFWHAVHLKIAEEYTVDVDKTPLNIYLPQLRQLCFNLNIDIETRVHA